MLKTFVHCMVIYAEIIIWSFFPSDIIILPVVWATSGWPVLYLFM